MPDQSKKNNAAQKDAVRRMDFEGALLRLALTYIATGNLRRETFSEKLVISRDYFQSSPTYNITFTEVSSVIKLS